MSTPMFSEVTKAVLPVCNCLFPNWSNNLVDLFKTTYESFWDGLILKFSTRWKDLNKFHRWEDFNNALFWLYMVPPGITGRVGWKAPERITGMPLNGSSVPQIYWRVWSNVSIQCLCYIDILSHMIRSALFKSWLLKSWPNKLYTDDSLTARSIVNE